jgi:hypothetical protein
MTHYVECLHDTKRCSEFKMSIWMESRWHGSVMIEVCIIDIGIRISTGECMLFLMYRPDRDRDGVRAFWVLTWPFLMRDAVPNLKIANWDKALGNPYLVKEIRQDEMTWKGNRCVCIANCHWISQVGRVLPNDTLNKINHKPPIQKAMTVKNFVNDVIRLLGLVVAFGLLIFQTHSKQLLLLSLIVTSDAFCSSNVEAKNGDIWAPALTSIIQCCWFHTRRDVELKSRKPHFKQNAANRFFVLDWIERMENWSMRAGNLACLVH